MLLPYTLLFLTGISSMVWLVVAICLLTLSHALAPSLKIKLMVLGSFISIGLWWFWFYVG